MKELTLIEQELAVGGNSGAAGAAIGSGIAAGAFGGSSPGCAVLGTIVGGAVDVGMGGGPMAALTGAVVAGAVTSACNNRPGYPEPSKNPDTSGRSAGYWPSVRGSGGFGGFGGSGGGSPYSLNLYTRSAL